MNNMTFDTHFLVHLDIGFFYIALCVLFTFYILRSQIYSVFDPLAFASLMSATGNAVVFYLYHFDLISSYYFFSFLLTQGAYFLGIHLNKPIKLREPYSIKFSSQDDLFSSSAVYLYVISFFIFFASQLIVYYVSGLPLLMESRHETFSSGSGYGIFSRLIYVTSTVSLSIASYRVIFLKRALLNHSFDYLVIVFYLLTAFLSGSKGSVILAIFIVYLTVLFAKRFGVASDVEKKTRRFIAAFLLLSASAAFFTIYVQSGIDDIVQLVFLLSIRFVHTGNIFFMCFPDNVINSFPDGNGFLALFKDVFAALRIIPFNELPVNLGLQAHAFHYGSALIAGPNARHNVFGLFYYGFYGSIIFSFILGYFFSYVRNVLYFKMPPNIVFMSIYVLMVLSANFIEQDPSGMAVGYYFSIILILPFLLCFSDILYKVTRGRMR